MRWRTCCKKVDRYLMKLFDDWCRKEPIDGRVASCFYKFSIVLRAVCWNQ